MIWSLVKQVSSVPTESVDNRNIDYFKAMFGHRKFEGKCKGKKIQRKSRRKEKVKENVRERK